MLRNLFCSILFFFIVFLQLQAANIFWIGGPSGNWGDPTNWHTGSVPNTNDNVYINGNCYIHIGGGLTAEANFVTVGTGSSLAINTSSALAINSSSFSGLLIYGQLQNRGTITVNHQNPAFSRAITVSHSGSVENWGSVNINYASQALFVEGSWDNYGILNINEAAASNQRDGIVITGSGNMIFRHNSITNINHTNDSGMTITGGGQAEIFGRITVKEGISSTGVNNTGTIEIYNQGRLYIRGATDIGIFNSGDINNRGHIRFFSTASGTALISTQGEIHNMSGGLIKVWGFQFDAGIEFSGNGKRFTNEGTIDIFTGQNSYTSLLFNWGSELYNLSGGEINVSSYAFIAMTFSGTLLLNSGQLSARTYDSNGFAFSLSQTAHAINQHCGQITFKSKLVLQEDSHLENHAWLDLFRNEPIFYANAQLTNTGVIYDRDGVLENFDLSAIDNSAGVIVMAPTDLITFGTPYTDYIIVGPNTNVDINKSITNGTNEIGAFSYDPQPAAYFNENYYDNPKYFYAELTISGCPSRILHVYNNTPDIDNFNGSNSSSFFASNEPDLAEDFTIYPNPATSFTNITLPNSLNGKLRLKISTISGQQIANYDYPEGTKTIRVERAANMAAGIYLLSVISETGEVYSQRLIFR